MDKTKIETHDDIIKKYLEHYPKAYIGNESGYYENDLTEWLMDWIIELNKGE